MSRAGIVCLGWNRHDITFDFLRYIYENTDINDFELCFVNNGSTDSTGYVLDDFRNRYSNIHVITNPVNMGVAYGWNQGIRYFLYNTDVEYLVIINNDIQIFGNRWLDCLLRPLKENKRRLVGPEYVRVNAATVIEGRMINYIGGWCLAFHRDLIDDVGYFNEKFFPCWYEDCEFSYRCDQLGYELYEVPDAPIKHIYGQTHSTVSLDVDAIHARNHAIFKDTVLRFWKPLTILFHCSFPGHDFKDGDWEGKGVGGAEASLICLSRELAAIGCNVIVANHNPDEYIPYRDLRLRYLNIGKHDFTDFADIFVQYRVSDSVLRKVEAPKLFWSTDQYTDGGNVENCNRIWSSDLFPYIDAFCCISNFHRNFIMNNYDIGAGNFEIYSEELGIKESDYWLQPGKQKNKFIYCSVPYRGLGYLFDSWRYIVDALPDAELIVTSYYRLRVVPQLVGLKNVRWLEKIPRSSLVFHQKTAELMLYPSIYEENYCISARECQAAGAVPVTTNIGALSTTVNKYSGICLDMLPVTDGNGFYMRDVVFEKLYADTVVNLAIDNERQVKYRNYGRELALTRYSWKNVANRWYQRFRTMIERKEARA